jgi:hypothetical protein
MAEKDNAKAKDTIPAKEEKPLSDKEVIEGFFDEIPKKTPIFVAIAGPAGWGKTHFANTFPNVVLGDTEDRAQIVMNKFGNKYHKRINSMVDIRKTISVMAKNLFKTQTERNNATFVLDSSSDFQQMAENEWLVESKKEKVFPLVLWAKIYERMDEIFNKLREFEFNAVFTQQLKEEYKGEKPTGNLIPSGYKKLPYRVDVHLHLQKGIEYKDNIYYPDIVVAKVLKDAWHRPENTKPFLIDITYQGIYNELEKYQHPGSGEQAILNILKELEKKTKIPMDKAKLLGKG